MTSQRECLFGKIDSEKIILSDSGKIVWNIWSSLPTRYPQIILNTAVIMPNHFHAIITIDDSVALIGAIHESPLPNMAYKSPFWKKIQRRRMLLPMVIGYLKMNSAKQINLICNSSGTPVWQRNYYEHIIQTEKEYVLIEDYIKNNPANWVEDQLWMKSQ